MKKNYIYKVGEKVILMKDEFRTFDNGDPTETYLKGSVFTIERYARDEPNILYCVEENNRFWNGTEFKIFNERVHNKLKQGDKAVLLKDISFNSEGGTEFWDKGVIVTIDATLDRCCVVQGSRFCWSYDNLELHVEEEKSRCGCIKKLNEGYRKTLGDISDLDVIALNSHIYHSKTRYISEDISTVTPIDRGTIYLIERMNGFGFTNAVHTLELEDDGWVMRPVTYKHNVIKGSD